MRIRFADASAVLCAPSATEIIREGMEAQRFISLRSPSPDEDQIDDDEMRDLMRQVVNRLYTFQIRFGDPEFRAFVDRWLGGTRKWDEPILDPGLPGVSRPDGAD